MRKHLLYGMAACAVLGGAAGYLAYARLGAIVKAAVESWGPEVTRTEVRVGVVTLSPFSGEGKIRRLFIGNPEGYRTPSAFELKTVRVAVDVKSLATDKVVVREIVVEGPEVTLEGSLSGSNLSRIQKNVESFVPASSGGAKTGKPLKVEIGLFKVVGGKLNLSMKSLGGKSLSVPLPDIELRGIGREGGGATVGEAARRMFGAVIDAALKAGAGAGKLVAGEAKKAAAAGKSAAGKLKGFFGKKKK